MRCRPEMMRLYAVTDRAWTKKKSLIEQVEEAICGGATCIQLREKNLDEEAFLREAIEMQKLCETYQVPLIINDHVEIAKHCKAAGVHLGQKDMEAGRAREILGSKMILGVSARTGGAGRARRSRLSRRGSRISNEYQDRCKRNFPCDIEGDL